MAEAVVGGAFLSGFINVMFERLLSPEAANLVIGKKLDSELVERLKIALCGAKALLVDAEHKQFYNESVKNWLDCLKDAVYKADDLLDHVITKAATQKEVNTFWPRSLFNSQDREMVDRIEWVVRRIEDVEKRKYILGLKEVVSENSTSWRTPSTSLVKGNIYGRENDQEAIIKIINDGSEHQLSVIPIVGMGGVGKTTLAQWLYNSNEDLMKGFDFKAWVCVSEEFDVVKVTETIIGGATSNTDLNLLQLDLKQKLSNNKFFIVLDDVWNDDGDIWNNFKTPFQYGAKGSIVLVTTRSKEVALVVVQTCAPHFLNELSDDYCWSVFADNACFLESSGNSTLEEVGRKIVKKCTGLPLAAETLGRLLRTKHDAKEWNTVLMTDIWEFPVKNSKIIPALLISYNYLPRYLKRCFVYCSLFPKDYRFDKDELILLWMAEDLLRSPMSGETLEEVGCECFDDLVSRLFFKKVDNYGQYFVMHDLMHDLAMFIGKGFYSRLEELDKAEEKSIIQPHHLSYGSLSHLTSKNLDQVESLRTLLRMKLFHYSQNIESTTFDIILSKLKYLRVLSYGSLVGFNTLPNSIGELIHLRYLDLSYTSIRILPESLRDLYNLQTLKLYWCQYLDVLPSGMHKLVNLRHLDIRETVIKEMPGGMSKLKHLQFLSSFFVGKHEDNGIKELGELSNLHRSLDISKLENVSSSDEAMGARILDKIHIDELCLSWSSSSDDMISDTEAERDILGKLQPHDGLIELTIDGYRGTRFPNWVGHSSYRNMTYVTLVSCSNCFMLPSLGQLPCLESLYIGVFNGLEIVDDGFYKNEDDHSMSSTPFPSLVELTFCNMPCWEVWHSSYLNAFPQLKILEIRDCPRLKGDMPNHLCALERLEIDRCQELVSISTLLGANAIRELAVSECNKVRLQQELLLSLETLSIEGCQPVESVFQAMIINHLTCLRDLEITNYSSFISFPEDSLPNSLKKLEIKDCRKLEFPKQQHKHELQELCISNSCDSLTSFPLEVFPNLNRLTIEGCENLESLSLSQSQHYALDYFEIRSCPNFVSFPIEGLHAPNMTVFSVHKCNKLKSLPCDMNTLLAKLKYLTVKDCPKVDGFPDEGDLPPNIMSLFVDCSKKLLRSLHSSMGPVSEALTKLFLYGGFCESMKSFPKHGLLPQLPSLTILRLDGFSNLETLDCNELLLLTSLQELEIRGCPKLENMEGERLPASLLELRISCSCLLAEHCKMKDPQIWPKISHIPNIEVIHQRIQ